MGVEVHWNLILMAYTCYRATLAKAKYLISSN